MTLDLSNLLSDWPYEPGRLNVRMIRGDDGEPKIQVRLDLGVLQMNMEGRPDGRTPYGFPSLLEYHEHKLDDLRNGGTITFTDDPTGLDADVNDDLGSPESDASLNEGPAETPIEDVGDAPATPAEPLADGYQASSEPDPEDDPEIGNADSPDQPGTGQFALTSEECKDLRDEAAQFYHRYVALLVLEDYEGVIRDTTRNLRLLDFCQTYAGTEEDREILEQVRPYITMMRARALASQAIKDNEPNVAINAIDEGLDALRAFYAESGDEGSFEDSNEAEMLRSMRETLVPKLPVSQHAELRQRLQEALARENYELAAILRDELKMMSD